MKWNKWMKDYMKWNKGVSRSSGLAIYIKKYLDAKEELWKFKNISPHKNTIFIPYCTESIDF